MAKILFVMKYPLESPYSVKGKFAGQMKAAQALGHDVWYIAYDHRYAYLIHNEEKMVIKKILFGSSKLYIHTKAFWDLFDSVCRTLKTMRFDVAYMRYCPLSARGSKMCRKIHKSGAKLVVEIPTYPPERETQPTLLRKLYMNYSDFWWKKAERWISLFTLIGDQANDYHGVPAINIDNGVCVEDLSQRQPKPDEDKLHFLAVASMSDWHGYDRMIRGIAALDEANKNRVVLHMVGDEGDGSLKKWKELVKEFAVEEQVLFHGRKSGKELDPFFDQADVGICSLGLYREGLYTASILKLREYCARGLPFVYAAEDPSVQGELPFCVQVPNDNTAVDVSAVIAFAEGMRYNQKLTQIMREYARKNMSWEAQFEKIFRTL